MGENMAVIYREEYWNRAGLKNSEIQQRSPARYSTCTEMYRDGCTEMRSVDLGN